VIVLLLAGRLPRLQHHHGRLGGAAGGEDAEKAAVGTGVDVTHIPQLIGSRDADTTVAARRIFFAVVRLSDLE
jgi:hypothetical protein